MTQRRRDSSDSVKPLYASERVEHHPSTVHPIALPAGPTDRADEQPHKPAPHTAAAHPRVTYPPAGHTPIIHPTTYQTSPHAAAARPAPQAKQPVINMAEQLAARPAQLRTPYPPVREDAGPLLIIGGAEQASPHSILATFVDLAGGADAHVAVIATASNDPDCREIEYQRVFSRLGAGRVTPLRITDRDQASSPEAAATILTATGVFFTGGDQQRITTVIGGTLADSELQALLQTGTIVLGGTSAGAAMMSATMIVGGDAPGVAATSVRTGPGLEFLPGVLIDMHFAERGRLNRLLSAVALYPHELGLGIDEDTAILADTEHFEVLGSGSVTVVDAGCASDIRVPVEGPIALAGARIHVLPAGHRFDLTGRRPSPAGATAEERGRAA
jgi:cyanophycinase